MYDGIPSFMTSGSSSSATLLAAYCGFGLEAPLSVESKSGYLTVYFEGNIEPSKICTSLSSKESNFISLWGCKHVLLYLILLNFFNQFTYIIYKGSSSTRGFNGTYHVNTCPSECGVNRECIGDKCVCLRGWGGINCETELCPNNCSYNMGQGTCDLVSLLYWFLCKLIAL